MRLGVTYRRKRAHWNFNFAQLQGIDVSGVMLGLPSLGVGELERELILGGTFGVLRTWTDELEFRFGLRIRSRVR
jgi:hypothetical protein